MPAADPTPAVILFDGVCNLCNRFVQLVIQHDGRRRFRFAALQSPAGQALLAAHGQLPGSPLADPDSVILLENGQVYARSAAVLRIARQLSAPWPLLGIGWALPRAWRDALYRYIARHRYRWFGRQQSCLLPTPALQERFLD